jgi:molecular chaperone GrpE
MGETTDRGNMQDDPRQSSAPPAEHGEHRGRARRREASSGRQHGQAVPDADGNAAAGAASWLHGLGDAQLSDAQVAALESAIQTRLGEEQQKAEEAEQRLTRTQADFSNYKRRNELERDQQARFATMLLVSEMLPVLDNLDRALATLPDSLSGLPWTDGLLLVDRQLRATLEKQGLQPINAVGTRFDPMMHEAIIHEETSEHPDDEVIAELRRGYMLHDKVVRPTLVKVAKHVEPARTAQEES